MVVYQNSTDKERGVIHVGGVCFPEKTPKKEISQILAETDKISVLPDNLMTGEALCLSLHSSDKSLVRIMKQMAVGGEILYKAPNRKKVKIKRYSKSLYIGEYQK